jgi:hypothetical protein
LILLAHRNRQQKQATETTETGKSIAFLEYGIDPDIFKNRLKFIYFSRKVWNRCPWFIKVIIASETSRDSRPSYKWGDTWILR